MSPDHPFPRAALTDCSDALCIFCAGFGGKNAEMVIRDAGITGLGIDYDAALVDAMRDDYPGWSFLVQDAYKAIRSLSRHRFDLVVADPQMNQRDRLLVLYPTLRRMARHHLVIGVSDHQIPEVKRLGASLSRRTNDSWWAWW